MKKWERFENYLFEKHDLGESDFTVQEVAADLRIDVPEASSFIQCYLSAQRSADSKTLFVLYREERTRNATWHIGIRTKDARAVGKVFFEDVEAKMRRALEPDLVRIGMLNPRAAKRCGAIITSVAEGAMKVLQAAVVGIED